MKAGLVLTTINRPNRAIREFSVGAQKNEWEFLIIGDESSPQDIDWHGISFYSLEDQYKLDLLTPRQSPRRHYARKNIGYLLAIKRGCTIIIESDDDNIPNENFWTIPVFTRIVW